MAFSLFQFSPSFSLHLTHIFNQNDELTWILLLIDRPSYGRALDKKEPNRFAFNERMSPKCKKGVSLTQSVRIVAFIIFIGLMLSIDVFQAIDQFIGCAAVAVAVPI